jgi:8-oxo-dGTP pyrophosphatase MutT (NUDIX family)
VGKNAQNQTLLITREFSSGGIVFKKENGKVLWLIRRTAPSTLYPNTYWMLPKGRIDDAPGDKPGPMASGLVRADERSLQSAATREVEEETGVEAKIIKKIGTIKYSFTDPHRGKIFKFVTYYLMEWEKDLPQGFDEETSEIAWHVYEAAYKTLSFSNEKEALKEAQELLAPVA